MIVAQVKIYKDGRVEALIGSQDIGGGARTVILLVTSSKLGYLPLEKVRVKIGDTDLPRSGTSAGSSTTPSVTREITAAVEEVKRRLFELVAPELGAGAADLEIRPGGKVGVRGDAAKELDWDRATRLISESIIGHVPTELKEVAIYYHADKRGKLTHVTLDDCERSA